MKKILLLTVISLTTNVFFAQKVMTRTGEIKFEASVPSFEEVKAVSKTVSCKFDASSGKIAVLVLIKSFKFKVPLMEEHFNENYMESSKYPNATFKGVVQKFDASKLSSSKMSYALEGDLTIHGVTQKIKSKITLNREKDEIAATCHLVLKPEDFKIQIPGIVRKKVAETVDVDINFMLE